MDLIYHEKQEGSLCAQHCLNSLLQGLYFSAVDLAMIAQQLDESERQTMAEGDIESPEYLTFLEQPSSNMDDSGFFSIQVISKALKVWSLDLIPFNNSSVAEARFHPEKEVSFICNFKEHWLTIRKIGLQWFNLNSLLEGPELLSETYLGMFLTQLQGEGYSIFVIRGNLPQCNADEALVTIKVVQTRRPRLLSEVNNQGISTGGRLSQDDLQRAMEESRHMKSSANNEVQDVQEAIQLSIQIAESAKNQAGTSFSQHPSEVNKEELRRKRQAFFDKTGGSSAANEMKKGVSNDKMLRESIIDNDEHNRASISMVDEVDMTEEAMLAEAIRLSMQQL